LQSRAPFPFKPDVLLEKENLADEAAQDESYQGNNVYGMHFLKIPSLLDMQGRS
jgi:hypothetical protein